MQKSVSLKISFPRTKHSLEEIMSRRLKITGGYERTNSLPALTWLYQVIICYLSIRFVLNYINTY